MSEPRPDPSQGLYNYKTLDDNERAEYLWERGEYVTGVADELGRSNFYTLHDYFVEVKLADKGDKITDVVPFKEGDRYERMVRSIDIGRLT